MSKDAAWTSISESTTVSTPRTTGKCDKTIHHNLAVNQKAVLQPQFRYRRWLEDEKKAIPEDQSDSIANIESRLPALRGPGSSVINYMKELERVEDRLLDFYNGNNNRFKKHTLVMKNAKHAEYQAIASRLLGIVGGSIGRPRDVSNPVLIGVGLGKFQRIGRLSSLHSTFLSFFIELARSLNYIVVGINEYYSSKKCPDCQEFVAQVTLRQVYCTHCKRYYHRDVMAAENMCNIVQGYLVKQERPRYLQPITQDGRYPWDTTSTTGVGTSTVSTSTSASTSASAATPSQVPKRTSSI
ncbi:hypothetical protein BGZ96_004453 [Linnemannia gamsii]|uniref:Cas12f1-like TNB domain-containing protein n=1 Tax=Linnemannia gamsii TaxID=64522 RepID=A0ABQ7K8H7_9FUNG|nr:hypothetical protein BGZ96_004453 [Linnemannia gamsii]